MSVSHHCQLPSAKLWSNLLVGVVVSVRVRTTAAVITGTVVVALDSVRTNIYTGRPEYHEAREAVGADMLTWLLVPEPLYEYPRSLMLKSGNVIE